MKIGFTGTREGLTPLQRQALLGLLLTDLYPAEEYHHGGAVGADAEFHVLVKRELHTPGYVVLHPCDLKDQQAVIEDRADEVRPVKPPLERNRHIVLYTDALVACPAGPEIQRSGTWSTIRYARRQYLTIFIVWPDGTVKRER